MDRLRKSLRESFRKKREHIPESSKPHLWQADEETVRTGNCSYPIKYLGCVEVFDSRGMQICEEALRVLRHSRRRPVRGTLFVTGDGLRVVDESTKGLLVDQTIEKVSFCAPDRNHERGFSYICRDGTTRRWICHGFQAVRDTGERLSHAVGCAFTVCLERKQRRDKEAVSGSFDASASTFTRTGSFRATSLTERLTDPQECRPTEPPPVRAPVRTPHERPRPHATAQLLARQGSLRLHQNSPLHAASPFKRQLSLRFEPSNAQRTRTRSLGGPDGDGVATSTTTSTTTTGSTEDPVVPAPIAEDEDTITTTISAMCHELSHGLEVMSKAGAEDPFDSGWVSLDKPPRTHGRPTTTTKTTTNPFSPSPVKAAFQVQM